MIVCVQGGKGECKSGRICSPVSLPPSRPPSDNPAEFAGSISPQSKASFPLPWKRLGFTPAGDNATSRKREFWGWTGWKSEKGVREVVKSCWPGTSSPNRMFLLRSSELNIICCQRFVYRVYKTFVLTFIWILSIWYFLPLNPSQSCGISTCKSIVIQWWYGYSQKRDSFSHKHLINIYAAFSPGCGVL